MLSRTMLVILTLSVLTEAVPNRCYDVVEECVPVCVIPQDCTGYFDAGYNVSKIYKIQTAYNHVMEVYCDMDTAGGWTVLQRRQDGSVNFYRNWTEYQQGFGYLHGEFWLGNDAISYITDQGTYELRVDLEDFDNDKRYAVYSSFSIDRDDKYRLSLGSYSGDAGDSLTYHANKQWSTYDNENDADATRNCAQQFLGGFWFNACHRVNINGEYGNNNLGMGINWYQFHGQYYSLKFTEMKIRRIS